MSAKAGSAVEQYHEMKDLVKLLFSSAWPFDLKVIGRYSSAVKYTSNELPRPGGELFATTKG